MMFLLGLVALKVMPVECVDFLPFCEDISASNYPQSSGLIQLFAFDTPANSMACVAARAARLLETKHLVI